MNARKRPQKLLIALAFLLFGTQSATAERSSRELRNWDLDFDAAGLQVGDRVPDLEVTTLDGERTALSSLWSEQPVVIVTGSVTCPVSRKKMPEVRRMWKHYGGDPRRLNVALLYTLEAHPKGSGSAYSVGKVEWVGKKNREQEIFFPQPESLEGRLDHAREFVQRMDIAAPIYVDGMNNEAWSALGGGPNMGFLIGTDGTIQAKHGWFDGKSMFQSVEAHFGNPVPGNSTAPGKKSQGKRRPR